MVASQSLDNNDMYHSPYHHSHGEYYTTPDGPGGGNAPHYYTLPPDHLGHGPHMCTVHGEYGPVTVPMVSTNSSPPIAMPVQVPPGHMVQQIVDESGTLRHVILSPQHHTGLLPLTSHNAPHYSTGPPNGTNGPPQSYHYPQGIPSGYLSPQHPHFPSSMPPGSHPIPTHPPGPSPPPSYYKDERAQKQYFKLKKKLADKQQKGVDRKELVNGIRSRGKEKGMNSVGTSEDGEESSSVQDEEDSVHYIIEMLSSVQAPQVSELSSRSALLQWSTPSRFSEAASDGGSEMDVSETELRYEVLLSEKSRETKYKSIYSGAAVSCRIKDLKPGVEYLVRLQVYLDELQGEASDPLKFSTPPCEPDQPQAPKCISRTKNSLQLRWSATNANGSHIQQYVLEYDEGNGGEFVELHKSKGNQHTLQKLTPATCYKFRLAAVNEMGRSPYSDEVEYSTSDNAPTQPKPPVLERAAINLLHLSWQKRPKDDEFTLQMQNPKYGFMTVYNGSESECVCKDLQRFTNYKFKLKALNGGGHSTWSEEVTFQTLPDRPAKPSKPVVKGRIHAQSFKLKWEPPSDTGGAEISKYTLEVNSGSGYETVYVGTDTEAVCDKLSPGTTYQLRVSCESIGGRSNYSDPCTVTTEAIGPGQCPPLRLVGKAKATSAVLRFAEPDYNGGAPILEYEVEMIGPDNCRSLVHKSKETEFTVTGLLPGCEYTFTVRAVNRIGPGLWSEELTIVSGAAPPEAPQPPLPQCKSPFHILVEWQEPPSNGSCVTEYRLEMSPTDNHEQFLSVYQGASTAHDIKNLTPFSPYYFRVQASNNAGYGAYSSVSATITPAAAPGIVQIVRCEVSPTTITIFWNEPASNGSPISHYNIEIGDQLVCTEGAVTEYTIESLQPESLYRVKIQAVNNVGAGTYSSTTKVSTLRLPPVAPRLECIGIGHNYLKLKWGEGKNQDYTQYCVEMLNQRSHEFQCVYRGTAFTCKVNKLQELMVHRFRIRASNDAGDGDYSREYEFTTTIAPPVALKAAKIVEVDQRSCLLEWLPSKNNTTDQIVYVVQVSRLKEQQFKQVYKGPETKCTVEHLEAGAEYCARICPIRLSQNGDLSGPFSPSVSFSTAAQEPTAVAKISNAHAAIPVHTGKLSSRSMLQFRWRPQRGDLDAGTMGLVASVVFVFVVVGLSLLMGGLWTPSN